LRGGFPESRKIFKIKEIDVIGSGKKLFEGLSGSQFWLFREKCGKAPLPSPLRGEATIWKVRTGSWRRMLDMRLDQP
jgi:hypothetical protein